MNPNDVKETSKWAKFYRVRGMNVVPSRIDAKRPMCRFAQWWESQTPDDLFDRFPSHSLQVMTGRFWRLLVIDLDGDEAKTRWSQWGRTPNTWITNSGGCGTHLWFRLPADITTRLPKGFLWKGDGPHQAIERLCDHSLVMAPPSIHPTTGERYRFLDRAHSPARLPLPADCPAWVLRLRPVGVATPISPSMSTTHVHQRAATSLPGRFDRAAILQAVPDKVGIARSWGLRVTGRPTQRGWWPCHAIGRDDVHPSAAIHQDSGHYVDQGSGLRLSFFDLGVQLGVYGTWRDTADDLKERYA